MNQALPFRRGAVVALADFLMLLPGLAGTVFCLVTAFDLPADGGLLLGTILGCALLAAAMFSLPRLSLRLPLCLASLLLLAALAYWNWNTLYLAAMVAARQVTGAFAEALGVGGPFDISPYVAAATPLREQTAVTLLLQLFTGLLALFLGWAVVRVRSFWLSFWGVFPLLLVPLSVTITPGWTPLLLLVLFWGVGLLTRLTRRQDPWGSARQTLFLLLPALALLLAVGAVFPQTGYVQPDWAGRARLRLTDFLTRGVRSTANVGGGLGLAGGGSADVDLGSAGPLDFDGRTVLRVEADTTGHIYLRGFSAATYTGEGWEQLPDGEYERIRDYQPLNFPAMADAHLPAVRVVIENVDAPDRFVYTPYQLITSPDRMTGAEFVGDAYLARGVGVWKHVLYARDRATPEHGGVLTGEAAEAERDYRAFVREHYLQIPGDMTGIIEDLVRDAGLGGLLPDRDLEQGQDVPLHISDYNAVYGEPLQITSDAALRLGKSVADYLAETAEYDPDTPAPGAGEDFVACFIGGGRGYCMHFASTAALMLRAMGVPARYVTGYVADVNAGERTDVPDYNAHAWVEIYCEGYGWQPVEVTPGFDGVFPWENQTAAQPTPTPPPDPEPTPSAAPAPTPSAAPSAQQGGQAGADGGFLRWLLLPAGLLLLCAALLLRRRLAQRGRARAFRDPDANRAVIAMYAYCTRVLPFAPGAALDPELEALGQKARFSRHVLTEEERERAFRCARTLGEMTDKALKWHKKLAFRYLFGLY